MICIDILRAFNCDVPFIEMKLKGLATKQRYRVTFKQRDFVHFFMKWAYASKFYSEEDITTLGRMISF